MHRQNMVADTLPSHATSATLQKSTSFFKKFIKFLKKAIMFFLNAIVFWKNTVVFWLLQMLQMFYHVTATSFS